MCVIFSVMLLLSVQVWFQYCITMLYNVSLTNTAAHIIASKIYSNLILNLNFKS